MVGAVKGLERWAHQGEPPYAGIEHADGRSTRGSHGRSRFLRRGRADDRANRRDFIGREASLAGMLANHFFVWRDVDAIHLVVSNVAFDPLDFRAEPSQHSAR